MEKIEWPFRHYPELINDSINDPDEFESFLPLVILIILESTEVHEINN